MNHAISDQVTGWLAGLRYEQLPAPTRAAACQVLLDASGVMLGASGLSAEVAPFVSLALDQGAGSAAVPGTGRTTSAAMAAFAGGAMAHALDYEDAFDLAPGHPNASLVPALIALAQAEGPVDGKRFLTALVAGCELSCRMGLALRRPMETGGWYPPPILAAFGAAAGAGLLLGLDAGQLRDALSLTLCQAVIPGEIKYSAGTVIRAVREAFPAQAAVTSALLARAGVAGFEQPLEGKAGFFALYAGGQFAPEELTAPPGERFWIEQLTFKPWPSCRGTHAAIELALDLRAAHGLDAGQIAAVTIEVDAVQQMLVDPLARKQAPETVIDAKFSIPWCAALALADGRVDLDSFAPERLADPALRELAGRITPRLVAGQGWQRGGGGAMDLHLTGGRVLRAEVANAHGCPARPLGEGELVGKFIDCASRAKVPPADPAALAERILRLEQCEDVGALFA
ncbi:MmgE/PrpD family protein [Novosphingobium sp.]|uniref:MmgE/PrpD family protein n=1 Tax=Novosphingobium sp. TaxID=1874826 RepID=UPI0035AFEA7D